jgi:aspartyl-tRNA(Asn)/glutamyl-tRNA(Gln) amidotransferase subunit B
MRSKEFANDYRYFPEPDLLPIVISDKEFKEIKDSFPELPEEKRLRFCRDFSIDENESTIIANSRNLSDFFESVIELSDPKLSANLIVGDISALLNKDNIEISDSKIKPSNFAKLIKRISDGTISKKIAKTIIEEVWMSGEDVDLIIETKGLTQIQDETLIEDIAKRVIEHNPDQVTAYKNGKDKLFGFFVGQIMKETQGKANPKSVNKILKRLLN